MLRLTKTASCLIAFALLAIPSLAQVTGNIPFVEIVRWRVTRRPDNIIFTIYDRNNAVGTLADIENYIHLEYDRVQVDIEIVDFDWIQPITTDPQTGQVNNGNEPAFLRIQFIGVFDTPPAPPPLTFNPPYFFPEEEGFRPIPGPTTPYRFPFSFAFTVPDFAGRKQERLNGTPGVDFDVRYFVEICATNTKEDEDQYGCNIPLIKVIENPFFRPPNPPAFADAGADKTVATGTTVELDGSRTLDAYNTGFNSNDPNIFEKDQLVYAWEFISGPVRVDPFQDSPTNPIATVNLTTLGTYEYRLTVDDGSSSEAPTTDSVKITVLEKLPVNSAPTAVIVGPASGVTVGTIITLDGTQSSDPDSDALTYRWRQTNAVGDPLTGEALLKAFQPLSGIDTAVSTWQAVTPGTYYFRLLVDDGKILVNTSFSVRVIDTLTNGLTEVVPSDPASDVALEPKSVGACGSGVLAAGLAPLALALLRRRT